MFWREKQDKTQKMNPKKEFRLMIVKLMKEFKRMTVQSEKLVFFFFFKQRVRKYKGQPNGDEEYNN